MVVTSVPYYLSKPKDSHLGILYLKAIMEVYRNIIHTSRPGGPNELFELFIRLLVKAIFTIIGYNKLALSQETIFSGLANLSNSMPFAQQQRLAGMLKLCTQQVSSS